MYRYNRIRLSGQLLPRQHLREVALRVMRLRLPGKLKFGILVDHKFKEQFSYQISYLFLNIQVGFDFQANSSHTETSEKSPYASSHPVPRSHLAPSAADTTIEAEAHEALKTHPEAGGSLRQNAHRRQRQPRVAGGLQGEAHHSPRRERPASAAL